MATTKHTGAKLGEGESASAKIDQRIADLGDWRGETLARVRQIIHEADPEIVEEWKWMGTPVFSRDGIICTGESYKTHVKLTFAKGASLRDPSKLFNSSLDGNVRRAIDLFEGVKIDAAALKALIREAIDLNGSKKKKPAAPSKAAVAKKAAPAKKAAAPKKAVPPKKAAPKKAVPKKAAAKRAAPKKAAGR